MTPETSKESRGHHPTGGQSASAVCGVPRPHEQRRRRLGRGVRGWVLPGVRPGRGVFRAQRPKPGCCAPPRPCGSEAAGAKPLPPAETQSTKAGTGPPPGAGWSRARQHRGAGRPTFLGSSEGPLARQSVGVGRAGKVPDRSHPRPADPGRSQRSFPLVPGSKATSCLSRLGD